MRYIILLSVLLIACATTTPAPETPCYFPGGHFKLVAHLEAHNCSAVPADSFEGQPVVLERRQCGVYKNDERVDKWASIHTILLVEANRITGKVIITNICYARYAVEFIPVEQ